MRSFKDAKGRSWNINFTTGTAKRVKTLTGVDVFSETQGIFGDELANYVVLCDVLYACVLPQAEEAKISDVEFGESQNGDTLAAAYDVLIEEIIDFYPQKKREVLRRYKQKMTDIGSQMEETATKSVEKLIALDFGNDSTQSQDTSELTRTA